MTAGSIPTAAMGPDRVGRSYGGKGGTRYSELSRRRGCHRSHAWGNQRYPEKQDVTTVLHVGILGEEIRRQKAETRLRWPWRDFRRGSGKPRGHEQ